MMAAPAPTSRNSHGRDQKSGHSYHPLACLHAARPFVRSFAPILQLAAEKALRRHGCVVISVLPSYKNLHLDTVILPAGDRGALCPSVRPSSKTVF